MGKSQFISPESIKCGSATHRLSHWREFIDFIEVSHANCPAFLYRGQANAEWKVESTLDRLEKQFPSYKCYVEGVCHEMGCPPAPRDVHLRAFKDAVMGKRGPSPVELTDDEWWILAQQHGLATPMLDFTHSPFIALFFAFEEECCHDCHGLLKKPDARVVFALSSSLIGKGNDSELKFIAPNRSGAGYRLTNQGGVFLKMPESTDLECYVQKHFCRDTRSSENKHPNRVLQRIEISNRDRCDCLKLLNKMNINRMSLFPDLDGAAAYVKQMWELDFDTSRGHLPTK